MDVDFFIDRLLKYYNVSTLSELGEHINTKQPIISGWKARNSISAVKKKCIELGIYHDIFGGIDETQIISSNRGQISQKVYGNQTFTPSQKKDDVDDATYSLFLESYQKAVKNDDLKNLRMILMNY